jgi:hypothetical protein
VEKFSLKKLNEVTIKEQYLTSWSWALLEKSTIEQPLKIFPARYGIRRVIYVFIRALYWLPS